ncbi:MAG TPA: hypothetical protein VM534_05485, partial [Thermoanaerobaculia bacterium]|nr:hypothetical protein [Thermoanaerobaculia bacterium]
MSALLRTLGIVAGTLATAAGGRVRRALGSLRSPAPLRIGVDIRPFYEPLTGVGWYLHELVHELSRHGDVELVLLGDARLSDAGPHLQTDLPPGLRVSQFDLRGLPLTRLARAITAGAYLPLIWLEGCDLIFGANYFLPRLMSAVAPRRVITVHDLTYIRHPELLQRETLGNLEQEMQREV